MVSNVVHDLAECAAVAAPGTAADLETAASTPTTGSSRIACWIKPRRYSCDLLVSSENGITRWTAWSLSTYSRVASDIGRAAAAGSRSSGI
jgi:hypothetical protein